MGIGAVPTRRFIRWGNKGIREKLLEILIDDLDYEWLLIDASHCKVHPKRGLNTRIQLAVDADGMPVRIFVNKVPLLIAHKVAA